MTWAEDTRIVYTRYLSKVWPTPYGRRRVSSAADFRGRFFVVGDGLRTRNRIYIYIDIYLRGARVYGKKID